MKQFGHGGLEPVNLRCLPPCCRPAHSLLLLVVAGFILQFAGIAQVSNLYSTGFEFAEGFDSQFTLIGQDNWTGTDSSGNGIVTNFFVNGVGGQPFGEQQAFVGFYPLTNTDGTLNVWRPLNFDAVASGLPVVTFSVTMSIYDSFAVTNRDCFRWSIYNTNNGGARLFTLDFDNTTTRVNYELDDNQFVWTGYTFDNAAETNGQYDLAVTMNFADNLWSAWLNDVSIVDSKPITTKSSALNLGDIDAVWVNDMLGKPGDNFMVFDNYTVTAQPYPFRLDTLGRLGNGTFLLRLNGEPSRQYAIEVSEDFASWSPLKTNNAATDGTFDFADTTASNYNKSFYRARLVQ